MRVVIFIIVSFFIGTSVLAADLLLDQNVKQIGIPTEIKIETVLDQSEVKNADRKYIELLERVNQQIALRWNPYNTSVAILAGLFALMSIVVAVAGIASAVMIHRQGNDYKAQREKSTQLFFEEQGRLNKLARDQLMQQYEYLEINVKNTLSEINARISDTTSVTDEYKTDKLKKQVVDLMAQQRAVQFQMANLAGTASIVSIETGSAHKCSQCGFGFKLHDSDSLKIKFPVYSFDLNGRETRSVTCPKCGNVDSWQA